MILESSWHFTGNMRKQTDHNLLPTLPVQHSWDGRPAAASGRGEGHGLPFAAAEL